MKLNPRDIPIVKLIPRYERKVKKRDYERIAASILAVGLIEPLVVCPEGDGFEILNGHVRYQILLEMGVESVPCLVRNEKDGYTNNRMVSHLSPIQETRMIRKSLDELDEQTIAEALAITVSSRMHTSLLKELHPSVARAFDVGKITKACARELTYVKPKRQDAILSVMEHHNDFSIAFARALVLKTAPALRNKKIRGGNPWDTSERKKLDLLKALKEAEEKHDFYSSLYRQYSINLLKLVIYARTLISNKRVSAYLEENYPDVHLRFREIISRAEG
ncbi:MAG: ParB/RepB/Spo0J family partition protein [Phycisphaerae bacterium]